MSQRQYEGQLARQVTIEDLTQPGGAGVADATKVELELREIFERIEEGDPTGTAVKNGNFSSILVPFTTSAAIDTEQNVEHNLGRVPIAWRVMAPARAGGSIVGSLYNIRDPDAVYLYLAVRATSDLNRNTAVVVW